jgi:pimeloyl-ACP methyl ester carboxylesterase
MNEAQAEQAIARLATSAERHDVTHAGTTVCWRRFGQGRPLVLLHGGHGSWLHWVRNVDALSQRHTLWIADLPGAGDSGDLPEEPATADRLEQVARVVQGSMDQLPGCRAGVAMAGFSFGALVAAKMAARCARVERLALLGVASHGGARRMAGDLRRWRFDDPDQRRAALRHNLQLLMFHHPHAGDALAFAIHAAACENSRFRS